MPPTDSVQVQNTAPKPNPHNNATMFQIFHNVQFNLVQHKKYVKEMKKLYKKLDESSFRVSFKNALMYLFTFGDTSANVDRVIQFVATFCTSLDDEEEFLEFVFEIVFECQCASGQSVRYRASQLLAEVLSALGDDASLDDNLCDKLLASQMDRLQDTRGAVRCRAALALRRLQNPNDTEDKVTQVYRFHMCCDPSSSVRRHFDMFLLLMRSREIPSIVTGGKIFEACAKGAQPGGERTSSRALQLEAIVMSIAKCTRNVPFVLERLRDADAAVRRAAFLYVAAINVTQLRVRQRLHTLKVGLTERCPRVRRVVEEILIPGWLSLFKGNIIDLLKAIRLDNSNDAKDSQYVAGKLLESLFKRLPISELLEWLPTDKKRRLVPGEKLNKETAWYWRHLAEHLLKIGDDETLEAILPDLVVLTEYIKAVVECPCPSESESPVEFSTRQYVLQELGRMLRVYDACDPAGRTAVQTLIDDVLTGDYGPLDSEVLRAFVGALELVFQDAGARITHVCSLVTGLRESAAEPEPAPLPEPAPEPADLKIKRAKLRVSLNVAMEAQEEAVREQNYSLAAECKAQVEDIQRKLEELNIQLVPTPAALPPTVEETKCDPDTLRKCLTILNCALDTPHLKSVTPMMEVLFTEFQMEIFLNPEIVETALETVALYGMLDKRYVVEHKGFFFSFLVDTANEPLVKTVLRCIADLLCVHGARVFDDGLIAQSPATTDVTSLSDTAISMSQGHSAVIEILLRIMDTPCPSYRLIIVECLCRLLQLGHLESPSILSRILLLWFNPATADEDMLRQTIGVFFQTFPTVVEGAQEQIQKATMPTLRALANAPSSSPLAEIDQEALIKFIVSLTRVNHEMCDAQGEMAWAVCTGLSARDAGGGEGALACRLLALLAPPRDASRAALLAPALRDLAQKVTDKQSCRYVTRYLGALEAMERMSLAKISKTEGTVQCDEDSLPHLGRTMTSLPQPIARSTHVVINETVDEEGEVDEISPAEPISKICTESGSPRIKLRSTESASSIDSQDIRAKKEISDEDSSGVSPVKKPKLTKGKKKLSINKKDSATNRKVKKDSGDGKKNRQDEEDKGGIKRSRSQRSLVDVERARKNKTNKNAKNSAKNAVRKSNKNSQSNSSSDSNASSKENKNKNTKNQVKRVTRSSRSSRSGDTSASLFEDSADETQLHTIVYDNRFEQSLLETTEIAENKSSKKSVTILETPSGSDESDGEPEPQVKSKVAGKSKKK